MRDIDNPNAVALDGETIRYIFLVDLQLDNSPIAFNSAPRSIAWNSKTFVGAGNLGSVGNISESTDLDPASCSVTLSGVNETLLSALLSENYVNRPGIIHAVMINANDQFIGAPFEWFSGVIDDLRITKGNRSRIDVRLIDELALWTRPKVMRYTHQAQQAKHPGDKGFEFVESIATREIIWPTAAYLRAL